MAKIRNISGDTLNLPLLNGREVGPDEVVDIPDEDVWPAGLAADSDDGLAYAAKHPDARNWDVPGVWADVAAPPPVGKPATKPEPVAQPGDDPAGQATPGVQQQG